MKQRQIKPLQILLLLLLVSTISASTIWAQELQWRVADPATVPPGRDDHSMVFMDALGLLLMFGGDNASSGTWLYNGDDWADPGPFSPGATREFDMVWDSDNHLVRYFGGSNLAIALENLWQFDGRTWLFKAFNEVPGAREDHASVYHKALKRFFLYGGDGNDGSTWITDGSNWEEIVTDEDGPGARWGHRMVYDERRNRVVLFGGIVNSSLVNDTWEFDGAQWIEIITDGDETSPSPRRDFAMVYDARRGITVLIGGRETNSDGLNDVWQWNGQEWTQVAIDGGPSPRHELAAAYDTWHNRIILFGGSSGDDLTNRYMNDTWILEPNLPRIRHTPRSRGNEIGTPFRVTCAVENVRSSELSVTLFYRTSGKRLYKALPMTRVPSGNYTALIPADEITTDGLEYYIGAVDGGITQEANYWRLEENPQKITVGKTGRLKVTIHFDNARDAGVRWRLQGTEEWLVSDTVLRQLQPGTYVIEIEKVDGYAQVEPITTTVYHGDVTFEQVIVPTQSN